MQAHDEKTNRPWGVLLIAVAIALVSCVGMIELARRAAMITPRVGDIVAFSPERPVASDIQARVLVARAGEAGCTLDVAAMRQTGGSLIVEERRTGRNPLFRVHWSGLRTTGDSENCGAAGDLVLHASDLEIVAMGAGGYGVAGKRMGPGALWGKTAMASP